MSVAKAVLIVDDIEAMAKLLERVVAEIPGLRVSGFAKNSWEARLELGRRKPDLVLLDEVLPGESSVELLVEIRSLDIPVILVTGASSHGGLVDMSSLPPGAAMRLPKPAWDHLDADRERFRVAIEKVLSAGTLSG